MAADAAELMHAGEAPITAQSRSNMARQCRAVREHGVVAELDVVRDMGVCHQQVVVADPRQPFRRLRSAVDGDELADLVTIADVGFGTFAPTSNPAARRRRWSTDRRCCLIADGNRTFDVDVGPSGGCAAPIRDVRADDTERTDIGGLRDWAAGSTIAVG